MNIYKKIVKVLGLISAFSFIVVILSAWIYQDIIIKDSIIRFYEPQNIIKYFEWILGIFSLMVLSAMIIEEVIN